MAVDYRASVTQPRTAAYAAQIYQSDHGLTVTVSPPHVVELLGYLGEPVFRFDRRGLWINAASPTAAGVGLVTRGQSRPGAAPHWLLRPGRLAVTWHDARVQAFPAGIAARNWSVPLIVDGRRASMAGVLRRFPAPAVWVWGAILGLALCLAALLARTHRRQVIRAAAFTLSVISGTAAAVLALAFALDVYASPGTWVLGLNAIVLLGAGIWMVLRGPEQLRVGAAIGVGLLAAAVGLVDVPVFLHPIVLAVLPGTAIRALAIAAIGIGVDAAALGCVLYAREAPSTAEREQALSLGPARGWIPPGEI